MIEIKFHMTSNEISYSMGIIMMPLKMKSTINKVLISGIYLLTISLLSTTAHADTLIYKWVDKNGVVSFSQDPPEEQGAHDITRFRLESLPVVQQRTAKRLLTLNENSNNAEFAARRERLKQADQRIDTAMQQLRKAEQELTEGAEPTGYDRVGNANGGARLRESYFNRVTDLQEKVDIARQELNAAYAERD